MILWNIEFESDKLNVVEVCSSESDGHQWNTKFYNYWFIVPASLIMWTEEFEGKWCTSLLMFNVTWWNSIFPNLQQFVCWTMVSY
jgi:hypothetical protein